MEKLFKFVKIFILVPLLIAVIFAALYWNIAIVIPTWLKSQLPALTPGLLFVLFLLIVETIFLYVQWLENQPTLASRGHESMVENLDKMNRCRKGIYRTSDLDRDIKQESKVDTRILLKHRYRAAWAFLVDMLFAIFCTFPPLNTSWNLFLTAMSPRDINFMNLLGIVLTTYGIPWCVKAIFHCLDENSFTGLRAEMLDTGLPEDFNLYMKNKVGQD
ncbi:hypothetical protein IQ265_06545 [Nodosilinea sp. LEGE 06152]|uniref:hypothetical protein n=1 Tax=Nodosilinea sp. LEGE 06152 TaxID=2777966 RepID=UPI00187E290A|nr:hypothetical protein [Nodosilinea sp. LEGE 06152]MBE9156488.1 hypothetical protein [Nodosilinea sp. LEGE 06152]